MVEGEEPRTWGGLRRQPNGALGRCGFKCSPPVRFAKCPTEAVLPRGFFAFFADDEWLR